MPPWPRFQPPPRQTQRAAFPHCAFLRASPPGLWDRACWERFRHRSWALHPVVLAQAPVLVQPLPPPPLPAAAPPCPCTPQMTPDFLFHPIFATTTAPPRLADSTVADPAAQARGDQRHHPLERLGWIPPKHLLQFPQQGWPLLQPRQIPRPPRASAAAHPPAVTPQEAHMLPTGASDHPAFFLIAGNLEGRQCLAESCVHGLEEPIMLWRGVHPDHESIGTPGLVEGGGGTTAGDLCGPLQPPIHRRAIPMAAERREHPAWRDSLCPRSFQPQLEPRPHVRVVDPLCHLRHKQGRPASIAGRVHIHGNDAGLVLHHRLRHAPDGVMGGALGAIAVRTRLEVRCTEGFPDALAGSRDHPGTDRRPRQHAATLPTVLGHRLVPYPPGARRAGDQGGPTRLQQLVYPAGRNGCKGDAVHTWRTVVGLGQLRGFLACVRCAARARQAPEPPGRCSLRLGVSPPAQVVQMDGCLWHRPPASHGVAGVTNRRVPALHGPSPASPLLRPPPSPSHLRVMSRWTGSTTSLASADCAAGRGGLRQLLRVSLSPCCRSHPAGVVRRLSQSATAPTACACTVAGSASGVAHLRGHLGVRVRYGLETRPPPADEAGERLQKVGFPSPGAPSYRALALPLGGCPPTEHTSLRWTHPRTGTLPCIRLKPGITPLAALAVPLGR